ncbi:MAG: hypothetical protein GY751_12150 [Bacteroidetes bacterium]|nr:hypothetical protein [Bacteroidota bacterium]
MNVAHHLHWLFIALYLLMYLIKAYLFLAGSPEAFQNWRKKTLVIENVFAVGFLVTGIFMLTQNGGFFNMGWFHLKLTLVVLAIPLGIVGYKKSNKALVFISVVFFMVVLATALYHGSSDLL